MVSGTAPYCKSGGSHTGELFIFNSLSSNKTKSGVEFSLVDTKYLEIMQSVGNGVSCQIGVVCI